MRECAAQSGYSVRRRSIFCDGRDMNPFFTLNVTLSSEATKRVALKPQRPTKRRTMPTSHPNTLDFSKIALQHDPGDAFAALPVHILSTHVLRSRILPDGSDLARL